MKINKFKKVGKSKYKLLFDNTEIILYEDIILKYDLLIKNDLDIDLIDKILDENRYYEAYYLALHYIEIKMRNKKEIIKYLEKYNFDEKYITFTLDKLTSMNLLNQNSYIQAFINDKINLTTDGPYKIRKTLIEADFDESDIDKYLNLIDDEIWNEKLDKLINKKKNIMKSKSYYMFIQKLKNDLYNLGYDKELIDQKLSKIEYESDSIEKEFNKANKKFKGEKTKIINSLLRKGYSYEEILNHFQ